MNFDNTRFSSSAPSTTHDERQHFFFNVLPGMWLAELKRANDLEQVSQQQCMTIASQVCEIASLRYTIDVMSNSVANPSITYPHVAPATNVYQPISSAPDVHSLVATAVDVYPSAPTATGYLRVSAASSDNVEPAPVMSFSDVGEHTESTDASDMEEHAEEHTKDYSSSDTGEYAEELAKELAEDFISDNSGLHAEVFKFYDVDMHTTKFGTMEEHAQFAEISSANDSVATPNFSDFFNFSPAAESVPAVSPSPVLSPAGTSTAATRSGKRQKIGLESEANVAPLSDDSDGENSSHLSPATSGRLAPTAPRFYKTTATLTWPRDKVKSENLLQTLRHFLFVHMDVVEALYRQTYGYSLIPSGMAPVDFYRKLAKVAKGNAWVPWLHGSNTNKQTGLQFLRRDDSHPESSCFNLLKRIGLTKDSSRVVLGPRLCCVLVIIGGMSADVMTGDLLGKIFLTVAGMHLNSLHVATAGGIANLSNHEVCELTKDWLLSVAAFVATEDNVAFTLESARVCNEEYLDKCTSDAGQNDAIALEMLENAEHCACLFLGISKRDLKVLCRYLPFLISKNTDPLVKDALRRVSDEMFGDIEIE